MPTEIQLGNLAFLIEDREDAQTVVRILSRNNISVRLREVNTDEPFGGFESEEERRATEEAESVEREAMTMAMRQMMDWMTLTPEQRLNYRMSARRKLGL